MDRKNLIRNIYLYLVTLIGLMMIVIPTVDTIKLSLETWVFPMATEQEYYDERFPPIPVGLEMNEPEKLMTQNPEELTVEDRELFEQWKQNYEKWQIDQESGKRIIIQRHRSLVRDISTLIVGLILFISHGYILRKDKKKK